MPLSDFPPPFLVHFDNKSVQSFIIVKNVGYEHVVSESMDSPLSLFPKHKTTAIVCESSQPEEHLR